MPTWAGFLFEFFGSFTCGVFGSTIFDYEIFISLNIHQRILLSSSVTTTLVLFSFHRTGGFFQPLLAFVRTFGCVGVLQKVTILDHIVVYWIGATLGAIVSMYFFKIWKPCLLRIKSLKSQRNYRKFKSSEDEDEYTIYGRHEDPLLEKVEVF